MYYKVANTMVTRMDLPMTRIYTQDNAYWEDYSGMALYSSGKLVGWVNETVTVSDRVMGYKFIADPIDWKKRKELREKQRLAEEDEYVRQFVEDRQAEREARDDL